VAPHTVPKSGDLVIRRSVSNQRLCSWRSKPFVRCISIYINGNFLKLHITYRTDIRYSRCTFGGDRSVMKDTSAEERAPSRRCLGFHWRDFPHNSHLSLYVNLINNLFGCLERIKIKVSYLNSCVTGRLYFGCLCRIVPEYLSAIKRNFVINSVILVAISHILSTICCNSKEFSSGTSV